MRLASIVLFVALPACHTSGGADGVDTATLPASVRDDYTVFSRKCSKCHALARPLESGITDDAYWAEYVERMRRQPGSGIAPSDVGPILRFLHYYSTDRPRRSQAIAEPSAPAPSLSAPIGSAPARSTPAVGGKDGGK